MAFCNSCGAALEGGAKFCAKCGAANPAASAASPAPAGPTTPAPVAPAAAAPAQGSSALKIILIVVAVIVGLGILGVGAIGFIGWRIAHNTHIHQKDGEVKVETPFGTVENTTDPDEVSKNLGVEFYPGASVVKGSSANVTFGNTSSAAVELETSDSVSAVTDFYKARFPGANVMSSEGDHTSIVAGDRGKVTTITIETNEGKTHIKIAKVTGKAVEHAGAPN